MAVLHEIKATAQACTRGSFSLLAAAAMVFAAGAYAQSMDTAYVPFRVNVNATATAQLAGGVKFEKLVRAGSTDTLHIISESTTPVISGKTPNPVTMHNHRGKISLELSRQLYKGVDIALYSLNGKQILYAKADASETLKSISRPNVRMGVYVLSVKGVGGNAFTTRLTHSGGGMNIDVSLANERFSSGSLMEKALPGDWTITVSAEGHLDTSYAFVPEAGRGNTPVQNITLWQISSPSSSSVAVVPSSSSATLSSSSTAPPLTCGTVPSSGYATLPITPPALACGNGRTATDISWLGSPAINWNNPKDGAYSDIRVMANCGTATDLIASCPGTLTVQPMISCSMAGTGYVESSAIALPALACSDGSEPFDVVFSGSLPDWDNPAVGSYEVLAEADCGQGTLPKISCGTFTVNPVTLACGSVSASIYEGLEISPPSLTCSHGALGTPAWTNEPDWSSPAVGTYTNISVIAACGSAIKRANCSGTLTVEPLLSCGSVSASGVSGVEVAPPVLNCKNGETASDVIWSGAPSWSNPAGGKYSNVRVTAACGTSSGLTANCNGSLQVYKTVAIGSQTWMAENLNYNVSGSKCYNNLESNCDTYGRLYDWSTAMNFASSCNSSSCSSQIQFKHRGICPAGWHIPSDAEWTALTDYVGSSTAGTKLKAVSGWSSNSGTDQYGFSALPGGDGGSSGSFYDVGYYGYWWSATENYASNAYYRYMLYNNSNVYRFDNYKSGLFSVRCAQD